MHIAKYTRSKAKPKKPYECLFSQKTGSGGFFGDFGHSPSFLLLCNYYCCFCIVFASIDLLTHYTSTETDCLCFVASTKHSQQVLTITAAESICNQHSHRFCPEQWKKYITL